jgi:hypothetical protein
MASLDASHFCFGVATLIIEVLRLWFRLGFPQAIERFPSLDSSTWFHFPYHGTQRGRVFLRRTGMMCAERKLGDCAEGGLLGLGSVLVMAKPFPGLLLRGKSLASG